MAKTFDWSDGRRKSRNMEENNGRVTLAVLKQTVMDLDQKIEYLTNRQEKLSEQIEKALHTYSERLRYLENEAATAKEQRRQHEKDINGLSARSNFLDVLVAAGAAIGTAIAAILGQRP